MRTTFDVTFRHTADAKITRFNHGKPWLEEDMALLRGLGLYVRKQNLHRKVLATMTFEQWWDSEARTPAPDTYKNWEESCRLAWIAAQEASQPDASAKTWCEYVAGMVGCYLGEPVESDKCKAIAAIIARRLWALPSPGQPIAVINAKGSAS